MVVWRIILTLVFFANSFASMIPVVSDHDSLWGVAQKIHREAIVNPNASIQQIMLAILDTNPAAFIDGNMNGLLSGSQLELPTDSILFSHSKVEAIRELSRQNALWKIRDMDRKFSSVFLDRLIETETTSLNQTVFVDQELWGVSLKRAMQQYEYDDDHIISDGLDLERLSVANSPAIVPDTAALEGQSIAQETATDIDSQILDSIESTDMEISIVNSQVTGSDVMMSEAHANSADVSLDTQETEPVIELIALDYDNSPALDSESLLDDQGAVDIQITSAAKENPGMTMLLTEATEVAMNDFVYYDTTQPDDIQLTVSAEQGYADSVTTLYDFDVLNPLNIPVVVIAILSLLYAKSTANRGSKSTPTGKQSLLTIEKDDEFFRHQVEAGESMLDLATAYIKMDNYIQAKQLLVKVIAQNDTQLTEHAKKLLSEIKGK